MIDNKLILGQIDIGIHPDLDYLSGLDIRLTTLDREGIPYSSTKLYKGDVHGSQVASIICGPYYDDLPQLTAIEAITIPRLGKTVLCLLRALDLMLATDIRVLCLPVGINLPTPVFWPFIKAFIEKGVLVIVPSGNKGKGTVTAPGSYPEVLTVGALNNNGNIARYTGRTAEGPEVPHKPNIFARGEFPDPAHPGSNKTIRGTSMACAYVAGKAARLWQQFPEATLPEIRAKLDTRLPTETHIPQFLAKPYIDPRLKSNLHPLKANDTVEGIIISGHPEEAMQQLPISQLLAEVGKMADCSPLEVNSFSVSDVVHLRATSHFFQSLLTHKNLFCAQAVDVSMFDM